MSYERVKLYYPEETPEAKKLRLACQDRKDLRQACKDGDIEEVNRLLDAGVPVDGDSRDVDAYEERSNPNHMPACPLMSAAGSGQTEVVALLLERGADLGAETYGFYLGTTMNAAEYADLRGHPKTAAFINSAILARDLAKALDAKLPQLATPINEPTTHVPSLKKSEGPCQPILAARKRNRL